MQGSLTSMSDRQSKCKGESIIHPKCNFQTTRKVPHSNQNPKRAYYKRMRCEKLMKWVDGITFESRKKLSKSLNKIRIEFTNIRKMLKVTKKGDNMVSCCLT